MSKYKDNIKFDLQGLEVASCERGNARFVSTKDG
jgi:hypothetical protein